MLRRINDAIEMVLLNAAAVLFALFVALYLWRVFRGKGRRQRD